MLGLTDSEDYKSLAYSHLIFILVLTIIITNYCGGKRIFLEDFPKTVARLYPFTGLEHWNGPPESGRPVARGGVGGVPTPPSAWDIHNFNCLI